MWANLAKDLNGIVAFSGDGVSMLAPNKKLTDNDAIVGLACSFFLGLNLGFGLKVILSQKTSYNSRLGKAAK